MAGMVEEAVEDVDANDVWDRLRDNPSAMLIDVRTPAEWALVGRPDLSSMNKSVVFVEWVQMSNQAIGTQFLETLSGTLNQSGFGQDAELFFICRSGVRSKQAAMAFSAHGYNACFNVADGFEGRLDDNQHRGRMAGWKVANLPWIQQ